MRLGNSLFITCLSAVISLGSVAVHAETLRIGGTGSGYALIKKISAAFTRDRDGIAIVVLKSLGSGGGIRALLAGALDIAVSSYPPKPEGRGSGATARAFAKTPLVFVTSRLDREVTLTRTQIVSIFGLKTVAWPDDSRVRVVLRPPSETDIRILVAAFDGMKEAMARAWARGGIPVAMTDRENLDIAEKLPNSLAVTSLGTGFRENRKLRLVRFEGMMPSVDALRQGRYPLSKTLYIVTRPDASPTVRDFVRFLAKPEVRAILLRGGAIPLIPQDEQR